MVVGIKMKVQMKIRMFKQALCELDGLSSLPECLMKKALMPYLVL